MVMADRSCEVRWECGREQTGFGVVIEGKEAQGEVCNRVGHRLKGS